MGRSSGSFTINATYLIRRFRDRYGITPQRWVRTQRAWP